MYDLETIFFVSYLIWSDFFLASMLVHACNARTRKAEAGGLTIQGQFGLPCKTWLKTKHKTIKSPTNVFSFLLSVYLLSQGSIKYNNLWKCISYVYNTGWVGVVFSRQTVFFVMVLSIVWEYTNYLWSG